MLVFLFSSLAIRSVGRVAGEIIEEVRRQIRRLGPVNAAAPEDYRETKERYDFLTGQVADLTDAEVQLREAIAELSEEIRQRFGVAFERVNVAFGEYFTAFFGGGSAQLILTDPDAGCEYIHDWQEWNAEPKSDPTAAARMREYRARIKDRDAASRRWRFLHGRDGRWSRGNGRDGPRLLDNRR